MFTSSVARADPDPGRSYFIEAGFARAEAWLARPLPWRVAIAVVLLLQATLIVRHAAWLDEWQALQIALQSPDLSALFENLRYEGHPPLWYFLLRVVGLFVPYLWVLAATQLLISLAMQALILFRAPFGRFERLLLGSSYFILFEFGTVSRSLTLGAFLTIAFFAAHDRRFAWAAIILLPMVDFLFGLLSLVAIALTIRDKTFSWPGAILWLASSLFAAWSIIPAPDIRPALATPPPQFGVFLTLNNLSALLVPFQMLHDKIAWGGGLPGLLGPLGGIAFLIFALHESSSVKLHALLFRAFFAAVIIFALFVYPLGIRHLTLVPMLLILLKWREVAAGFKLDPWFKAWLAVLALGGAAVVGISLDRPFDSAPRVAEFIRANQLQDKRWISFPDSMAQAVAGLLDREMETIPQGCTQSFIRWNIANPNKSIADAAELDEVLKDRARTSGRFYMISAFELDDRITVPKKKIAEFTKAYNARNYYIYVVAPSLPERSPPPPRCPPRRISLGEASLLR